MKQKILFALAFFTLSCSICVGSSLQNVNDTIEINPAEQTIMVPAVQVVETVKETAIAFSTNETMLAVLNSVKMISVTAVYLTVELIRWFLRTLNMVRITYIMPAMPL